MFSDFNKRARWTWKHVKTANSIGITPTEETITEMNLIHLQKNNPNEIKTQTFSKYAESRKGADWDWTLWVGSKNNWLPLAIQAKRLDPITLNYPHLDYKPKNSPIKQIDLLINHAQGSYYPKIPLYVFYNYWDRTSFNAPWFCPIYPKSIRKLGCSISSAFAIKTIINQNSNKLSDVAKVMYPWSCLICGKCIGNVRGSHNTNLVKRVFTFITHKLNRFIDHFDFINEKIQFIQSTPPHHVLKLLEEEQLDDEDWEKIGSNRISVIYEHEFKTDDYVPFEFR